jgi:biotin transport system substrate-specific component
MAAGLLIVFAGGVSWLSLYTPGPDVGMAVVRAGFLPFVPVDVVKILVGATVLPQAWRFLGARHLT